jgi:hypothetical protein
VELIPGSRLRRNGMPMALPPKTDLPCFVYGLFKPDELAFQRLSEFLEDSPVQATAAGTLWVRDGLPLLEPSSDARVDGYLLRFNASKGAQAYDVISKFEPAHQYRWQTLPLLQPSVTANALVGLKSSKGSVHCEEPTWSSRDDPVFSYGVREVKAVVDREGHQKFESAPPDSFDWPRFFRLQMAYLLLWSAIERYTALSFGPDEDSLVRVKLLGQYASFKESIAQVINRKDTVVDSRDPNDSLRLDAKNPVSSAKYFYQIRCNLGHRGKGAWNEAEKVRLALNDLLRIFELILKDALGGHPKLQV